jgi:hypothetical protein
MNLKGAADTNLIHLNLKNKKSVIMEENSCDEVEEMTDYIPRQHKF